MIPGDRKLIKFMLAILFILVLHLIISVETEVSVISYSSATDSAAYLVPAFASDNTTGSVQAAASYTHSYPDLYASSDSIPKKLPKTKKYVYLTFDDGPSSLTDEILDILDEHDVKATFFVMGCGVGDSGRKRLTRITESGHTIGIHTFSHDYKKIYSSVDSFLDDFYKVYKLVTETTGVYPNIFRFPGGSNNIYIGKVRNQLIAEMTRRGFTYYDWTVSAEDSVGNPTKASINKYLKLTYKYFYPVVLMHDSAANNLTVSVLSDFITELKEAGYKFDTLDNRVPIQY